MYKQQIDENIDKYIKNIEIENIKNILLWCFKDGKRLRPMIALDVYNRNLNKYDRVGDSKKIMELCLAVECLHTSSLILDDLPCMDNDNLRRNRESCHIRFGETNAYLISYYLINDSLKLINKNIHDNEMIKDDFKKKIDLLDLFMLNYQDVLNGQFRDIYPIKIIQKNEINFIGKIKRDYLIKIISDKTSPFFDLSFILGYVLSGGEFKNISKLRKLSKMFGLLFQISDDFEDRNEDLERNNDFILNYCIIMGEEKAYDDFTDLVKNFRDGLRELDLYSDFFKYILEYLIIRVKKNLNN